MIRYFANHPTAANLMMAAIVILGAVSLPGLRRETFPDFSSDKVEVRVVYPGASAGDVEEAVVGRLEDALDMVSHVEELHTEAREGLAIATVEMAEGRDLKVFMDDIRTEIDAVDDFPAGTEKPVIRELGKVDEVVSIAVSGAMSITDLKAYCELLKNRLKMNREISLVDVQGFSDHQIQIRVPAVTLMKYGLSARDIADSVSSQSLDLPAGTLETVDRDLLIRFSEERITPERFADLVVVYGKSGAELRLGQIAEIYDRFELEEEKLIFDGKRSGLLVISKTEHQDALTVLDEVKKEIDIFKKQAPDSVTISLTKDMTSLARDRLKLLLKNGWQGLLLVFFTLWLFFNIKLSFWVAMGLPVSFLGAFIFMPQMDYTLNIMTMVGLLMALGLLMDDAIVIAENVAAHLAKGKSAMESAIHGTMEVKAGVISSFLTTVCIFTPISFLSGTIGKVLKVVPVVMILVLAVSLVEAFFILPRHLGHALDDSPKGAGGKNRIREKIENAMFHIRENMVGRVVDWTVAHRHLTVTMAVSVFILSVGMLASGILKFQPFPALDGDVVEARILLPQGTPISRTEEVVDKVVNSLAAVNSAYKPLQPEARDLVGHVSIRFNRNKDAFESGPHVATVTADLLSAEIREGRVDDILSSWRKETGDLPDVIQLKYGEPALGPAGHPIEIRLSGDDLGTLKKASVKMQAWLNEYKGVLDLEDDLRPGKPEIKVRMREGALSLGLTARQTALQLQAAFFGKTADEVQAGEESYEIDVQLAKEDQDNLGDLENFHVTLGDGSQVPLSAVASLDHDRGYGRIAHVDGVKTVTIIGEVDTRVTNTAELLGKMDKEYLPELKKEFPDVRVAFAGEARESGKTGASLRRGFMIGLAGIFILLSFQFKSYVEPLMVMAAIPFALVGVIWGHLLMGIELCMPSMMGFASLAGVVVNDSILHVEFTKIMRKKGLPVSEAGPSSSRMRFRAVMLTTLTTVAGLLPLLSEKSLQAQVLIPLAVSIVFGLLASTLMVLFVLPAIYAIVDDLGLASRVDG